MKHPSNIFSHLFPNAQRFREHKCFQKLVSLLPPSMQKQILYIYKKGDTLYFVLTHPGFLMEFNYNKKHINEVLNLLAKRFEACSDIKISQIKAYHKYTPPAPPPRPKPLQRYKERACGEFEIATQNEELKNILEQIRQRIKNNAEK